jgi:hypothetical protein
VKRLCAREDGGLIAGTLRTHVSRAPGGAASVSDTTPQTGLERASGQVRHRAERTVEGVVEVLVQRRHDRTNHNRAPIASATRTGPERSPLPPGVRAEPATGRGGAGVSRPRRSE